MSLNAIIAALYAILTIVLSPIAYGAIQFRFSEILVLLCFFNRKYIYGLTLGCFIANCFSPTAPLDMPFGTTATFIACLCIILCKHLVVAIWFPVIVNALLVGYELTFYGEPFWMSAPFVALGELAVMVVGYIFFIFIKKNKGFMKAIRANQNTDFKF